MAASISPWHCTFPNSAHPPSLLLLSYALKLQILPPLDDGKHNAKITLDGPFPPNAAVTPPLPFPPPHLNAAIGLAFTAPKRSKKGPMGLDQCPGWARPRTLCWARGGGGQSMGWGT